MLSCTQCIHLSIYYPSLQGYHRKAAFFGNPLKITPVFGPFLQQVEWRWHVSPANTNLGHNTPDLFVSWQACSSYPKRLFSSTSLAPHPRAILLNQIFLCSFSYPPSLLPSASQSGTLSTFLLLLLHEPALSFPLFLFSLYSPFFLTLLSPLSRLSPFFLTLLSPSPCFSPLSRLPILPSNHPSHLPSPSPKMPPATLVQNNPPFPSRRQLAQAHPLQITLSHSHPRF